MTEQQNEAALLQVNLYLYKTTQTLKMSRKEKTSSHKLSLDLCSGTFFKTINLSTFSSSS